MTTRKRTPSVDANENLPSLGALLSGDGDVVRDSYGDVDPNTLQRLVHVVTAIGGFCTFWYDDTNSRLSLSVRLGTEKKSFGVEDSEGWNMIAESLVGKMTPAMRKKEQLPPPPPTPIHKP